MSNLYFQRSWSLYTKRNGVQQLIFTSEGVNYPYVANRLVFKCTPYAKMGDASFLEVTIYNLSESQKNNILENDDIFLEVGYVERGMGLAFSGKVQSFNGFRLKQGNDFNYVFTIYCMAYFAGGSAFTPAAQSLPQSIDLSENYVSAPFTVGNQALRIGQKFGYQPRMTGISPSISNTPAFPMVCSGTTMNMLLSDFSDKTGYYIAFDGRDKTYTLSSVNPTQKNYSEFFKEKEAIIVDRNHGLVDYPTYDIATSMVRFTRLIDTDLDTYVSCVNVDVSNTMLSSFTKKTTQTLLTEYQNFIGFVVMSFSYEGDTRGDENSPWYQHILAFGVK